MGCKCALPDAEEMKKMANASPEELQKMAKDKGIHVAMNAACVETTKKTWTSCDMDNLVKKGADAGKDCEKVVNEVFDGMMDPLKKIGVADKIPDLQKYKDEALEKLKACMDENFSQEKMCEMIKDMMVELYNVAFPEDELICNESDACKM